MRAKRTTGKFDSKGVEIFEGDKVIHAWMWSSFLGKGITVYQIHTITVREAHLMANGEMHDDGGGIIFCLGEAYNFWKGETVTKLTDDEIAKINIPNDKHFFFNENGDALLFTDQHFCNVPDDQWGKHPLNRKKRFEDLLIGKTN